MGCTNCRRINREEACVEDASELLGLSNRSVKEVDNIIRKHSSDSTVYEAQFKALSKALGLTSDVASARLFSRLRNAAGVYDRHSLIVLGAMLAFGKTEVKAQVLFEAFDNLQVGVISVQELKTLLGVMTLIAADLLPELVVNDTGVQEYASICRLGIPVAEAEMEQALVEGDEVKKRHFIQTLVQLQSGRLVHPSGLRGYLFTLGKKQSTHVTPSA
jgi:Ca2+-binding EF-hand superfamily protein